MRLGAELPQIIHQPPDVASQATGDDAIALANEYLFGAPACLSPSQELRLRNGMSTRSDGKWAASRVGDFGGRQGAGKTDTILARILAGVMLLDERLIIYTAHEFPTANEIFLRLLGLFENWDDLGREMAKPPKRAHGDQGFELTGSRRILIKTRTGKSGRGFAKADLLVYDEAQHLQPEHVAGSGPAKLAHPNPQSWYAGSGGLASSSVAWTMRRQALTRTGGRLSYTEHTAQTATVEADGSIKLVNPDPADRKAWALANPGLGRWVTEEGMENLRDELGDLFPREGLCVWEPEPSSLTSSEIPRWAELADPRRPDIGYPGSQVASNATWALVLSPLELGPQWASFGLAGKRADGRFHVEALDHRIGTWWVKDRAKQIFDEKQIPLRMRASGAENGLIKQLREAGVEVEEVSTNDASQAFGAFISATTFDEDGEPQLHHLDDPDLNKAVRHAKRRSASNGSASWDEVGSSVEITPLVAVTVALGGVSQASESSEFVSLVLGG